MAVDEPVEGEPDLEAPHGRPLEADDAAGPVAVKPASGWKDGGGWAGQGLEPRQVWQSLTTKALYQRFYRQIRRL